MDVPATKPAKVPQTEPKSSHTPPKENPPKTDEKESSSKAGELWHEVADVKAKPSFEMDFEPSEKGWSDENTPWYKHWGFWTALGVAAFAGGMIGVYYVQKDPKDSLVVRTAVRP